MQEVKDVSKAHIPGVDHVLKKPYVSDCCYRENGDFNPTYHDWLERERDRDGGSVRVRRMMVNVAEDRHREAVDPREESKVGECG